MIFASSHGKSPYTLDGVSPLDETALARQFQFLALSGLETSQLGPTMTGLVKTEERRGMKSYSKVQGTYRRGREFPRSPEGARI